MVGFPPKSSILKGFSIINHPFWGITILGNTHIHTTFQTHLAAICLKHKLGLVVTVNDSDLFLLAMVRSVKTIVPQDMFKNMLIPIQPINFKPPPILCTKKLLIVVKMLPQFDGSL